MTILAPHDYPYEGRPHRYYFALTNNCNRLCPWCSTYSSPGKKSFLSKEIFKNLIPRKGIFEVQFEGGEPTLHPDLLWMVQQCRQTGRCHRVIICTNGANFPFKYHKNAINFQKSKIILKNYFFKFGYPITIKLSINHHLLEYDQLLFEKARIIVDVIESLKLFGDFEIILNMRRRNNPEFDFDNILLKQMFKYSLQSNTNIFFLQAYGKNKNDCLAEKPFLVGYNFTLINPDGKSYGTDLISRSDAMKNLP